MADTTGMAMNGVARAYWDEVLDLRVPIVQEREKRAKARPRKLLRTRTLAAGPRRATG
jgi:hypothetical protein